MTSTEIITAFQEESIVVCIYDFIGNRLFYARIHMFIPSKLQLSLNYPISAKILGGSRIEDQSTRKFPHISQLPSKTSIYLPSSIQGEKLPNRTRMSVDLLKFYVFIFQGVRTILIHPASPSLIKKYTRQDSMYIIDETYEIYQTVTLPYILSMGLDLEV